MNNKAYLAVGAAIGFVGGYLLAKFKYEAKAKERIDRANAYINEMDQKMNDMQQESLKREQEMKATRYAELSKLYSPKPVEEEDGDSEGEDEYEVNEEATSYFNSDAEGPKVVDENEFDFDDYEDYTIIGITYYDDGCLVEDGDERLYAKQTSSLLGLNIGDIEYQFGDDDCFHVVDKSKHTLYEIIRVDRPYLEENFDEYYDK